MNNSGLCINFGVRSKQIKKCNVSKNIMAKRIIQQVKKMYPEIPECIIGETHIGGTKAKVFINPEKQTLKVLPKEFTNPVLVKLSKYFHKRV